MKNTTIITMAALMLGTSGLMAQTTAYTKPSGFVTHTLKAGQFNLIGLTLHNAVTVTGKFTSVAGTTLTDTNVDFTATLTAGKTYILEITSGTLLGSIQEVTTWSGNTITTTADLVADGLLVDDTYQLREAASLASVFGPNNEGGLQGGASATVADNIYLPTAAGTFDIYYYSTGGFGTPGWKKVGTGDTDVSDQPIILTDGFYVYRKAATDLDLVFTGTVKVVDSSVAVTGPFTYVSGVYPVGSTLGSSNMKDSLTAGASATVADQVFIQQPSGVFDIYYYSSGGFGTPGWKLVGGGDTDQSGVLLPAAFVIKRVNNTNFNLKLSKPAGYENL